MSLDLSSTSNSFTRISSTSVRRVVCKDWNMMEGPWWSAVNAMTKLCCVAWATLKIVMNWMTNLLVVVRRHMMQMICCGWVHISGVTICVFTHDWYFAEVDWEILPTTTLPSWWVSIQLWTHQWGLFLGKVHTDLVPYYANCTYTTAPACMHVTSYTWLWGCRIYSTRDSYSWPRRSRSFH